MPKFVLFSVPNNGSCYLWQRSIGNDVYFLITWDMLPGFMTNEWHVQRRGQRTQEGEIIVRDDCLNSINDISLCNAFINRLQHQVANKQNNTKKCTDILETEITQRKMNDLRRHVMCYGFISVHCVKALRRHLTTSFVNIWDNNVNYKPGLA